MKCSHASPWSNLEPALSLKSSEPAGASPKPAEPLIASPCVRQCCLNERDMCLGCGRLLNEILEWGSADHSRRRLICHAAQARLQQRQG
ncbi:DUF1289 domain-containing protein [Pseudomonas paeninsulae]|uniref:DUF1289 domain-containing protein n=1 Tax=Pseudomonas paeninsulae TaxID=3110772 RepID=UPI00389984EC